MFGADRKPQLLNRRRCSSSLQRAQRQRWDQMEPQNHRRVPACAGDTCKAGAQNMKVSEMHACSSGSPREARGTGLETITRADNFGAAAAGFAAPSGSENYNSPPRQQLMVERRPADANRPTLQLITHTKGRASLNTAELFSTQHTRGKMLIPVASIEERSVNSTLFLTACFKIKEIVTWKCWQGENRKITKPSLFKMTVMRKVDKWDGNLCSFTGVCRLFQTLYTTRHTPVGVHAKATLQSATCASGTHVPAAPSSPTLL